MTTVMSLRVAQWLGRIVAVGAMTLLALGMHWITAGLHQHSASDTAQEDFHGHGSFR